MTKILFLTKYREHSYNESDDGLYACQKPFSSGLYNSVKFIVDMLLQQGHDVVHESCIDNNCIDRLVTLHRPTHVILEALWVVPSKLDELMPLHPGVKWALRLHSEVPFLASEGIAIEWLRGYAKRGVILTANSLRMCEAAAIICHAHVPYTPNYYPVTDGSQSRVEDAVIVDVGCFGAIRPLKNHLMQAKAAIRYAEDNGKILNFHINGTRVEGNGGPVLKNLRALFDDTVHQLVEHEWLDHVDFRRLVAEMAVVLQCSFSETYNIVIADAITENVPVVASNEVRFVSRAFFADPTDLEDIAHKIARAISWGNWGMQRMNKQMLRANSRRAIRVWNDWIRRL